MKMIETNLLMKLKVAKKKENQMKVLGLNLKVFVLLAKMIGFLVKILELLMKKFVKKLKN